MDPYNFEKLIAELYRDQGFNAKAVGGVADGGIDVEIYERDGSKWGVAQCKRYGSETRVSSREVREFVGAFHKSRAKHGLFFTTGRFTRYAKKEARHHPWLQTYDGPHLVKFIEQIKAGHAADVTG